MSPRITPDRAAEVEAKLVKAGVILAQEDNRSIQQRVDILRGVPIIHDLQGRKYCHGNT